MEARASSTRMTRAAREEPPVDVVERELDDLVLLGIDPHGDLRHLVHRGLDLPVQVVVLAGALRDRLCRRVPGFSPAGCTFTSPVVALILTSVLSRRASSWSLNIRDG